MVFLNHQGSYYLFIRTTEGDDPPVYFYQNPNDDPLFPIYFSQFSEYLSRTIQAHAKFVRTWGEIWHFRKIRPGYFDSRLPQYLAKAHEYYPYSFYGPPLGYTEEEAQVVARSLDVSLPKAFHEFLLWMGYSASQVLSTPDSLTYDPSTFAVLKKWLADTFKKHGFLQDIIDDIIVLLRISRSKARWQFRFFRASEGEDPPLYFYDEENKANEFTQTHQHLSQYIAEDVTRYATWLKQRLK